ncbi:pentapeptide repeat-containing protein [Allokutzneria sp. A3M-2-11 16]|uniref:pentapeptide repeat-containing protein n=1 Tax=Allokutzneria sp. A3M-2-11 16 TaxID=2962043 RepID=UPI0020B79C57|nr:pentapeptide repeat-containing protein [Allokutzneria sp. A3M-2-11 16]MCP3800687.1 pentapeptide repeat-containing protein [Allokutzneria sp. A3M-2-11 16]
MPLVAVLVLAATALVLMLLWRWIDGLAMADEAKKATAQLDAIKVAASTAVGGGGLFALYLAARRQRTQELELDARHAELRHREAELAQRDRVQSHAEQVAEINRVHAERVALATERDSADRRVTDLYAKSVEQLGSEKAPVRLGGLYALERLAQDNPHQRPTVVAVLCAYLRMPYTPPAEPPSDNADESMRTQHSDRVQERQVRLAAQRILATHLRPINDLAQLIDTFWPNTDLDLAGAVLLGFDFTGCLVRTADFQGATFIEDARFRMTKFTGAARFDNAKFTADSFFNQANFNEDARFQEATFTGSAWFERATFTTAAVFRGATFLDDALFDSATFLASARFFAVTFASVTSFDSATFKLPLNFHDTIVRHEFVEPSAWPTGWLPSEKGFAVAGRKGTWHFLARAREAERESPS